MKILFFKDPNSDHFLNLNHFPKSFIKIILHSHLFKFLRHFRILNFFFFKKKKEQCSNIFSFSFVHIQNVLIVHFLFQL